MDKLAQNSCIITTSVDEETGKTMLMYIPTALNAEILDVLLEVGKECANKEAVYFELEEDGNTFWERMWAQLKED